MKFIRPTLYYILASIQLASATPDIAEYGQLPASRSWSISPNGTRLAHINRGDEFDQFVVHNRNTGEVLVAAQVKDFKARSVYFVTEDHIILRGSETTTTVGFRGRREHSGAVSYNVETGEFTSLLRGTENLHPAQTGMGRIVGVNRDEGVVYMPAYADWSRPEYNLYRVNLSNGIGVLKQRGIEDTQDWFVNRHGKVLAREDIMSKSNEHRIYSMLKGDWERIYELKTKVPDIQVMAVGNNGTSLLFKDEKDDYPAIYRMSLKDGSVSGPVYSRENAGIDDLLLDLNRQLVAVVYGGFKPSYEFVEPGLASVFSGVEQLFPRSSIYIESYTKDMASIIFFITGPEAAGEYYLYSKKDNGLSLLGKQYDVPAIAPIKAVNFTADDGTKIPAIITLPVEQPHQNLPLIVLPHGGPTAYDSMRFDWLAQFLAAKGYAVLQPNFRGSTGFGYSFRNAGKGEWGDRMQKDVSDGVAAMVESGYADPDRVCILGMSYGGYSALAGGAFTADLYRCVVAVNAVTDVAKFIRNEQYLRGTDHWVVDYWKDMMGEDGEDLDRLDAVSPVNFAEQFQSPVLLIHSEDDTVVDIDQSEAMYDELEEAGKAVSFVELEDEDHWLSTNEARVQLLEEIDQFLDHHNPVNTDSAATPEDAD